MRKFIVSDIHGCGDVYKSIMYFLDNINLDDEVELYINGDLFDRGIESYEVLMDVYNRINSNNGIKIKYLVGNHELMFYQECLKRKKGRSFDISSNWMDNGGWILAGELEFYDEDLTYKLQDFMSQLCIYHVFKEKINNQNILLVHAAAQANMTENLKLKDNNREVFNAVWTRKGSFNTMIGSFDYFTIVGHTPVLKYPGFSYNEFEKYLNIDGGCAYYTTGSFKVNHVPLVEVLDNELRIIIFDHSNKIIGGYILRDNKVNEMNKSLLDEYKKYINKNYKVDANAKRKLIKEYYN